MTESDNFNNLGVSLPSRESSTLQSRRRVRNVLIAAILIAAVPGWYFATNYYKNPKRIAIVRAGVLYRSAQPKPRHLKTLIEQYGIRTLFIVRDIGGESVQQEIAEARRLGITVIEAPVESRQPVPENRLREFFACVDNPDFQPVLVHCSAGRHRTGVLCAAYRIERDGWPIDRAIDELISFGFDVEVHKPLLQQVKAYRPHYSAATMTSASEQD